MEFGAFSTTGAILRHLDLPHTAPRLSSARAPPQAPLELDADPVAPVDSLSPDDLDQTPAFDPANPEPVPELDFDQPAAPGGRAIGFGSSTPPSASTWPNM